MTRIHATAQVDSAAELDDDVEVGAYSVIGPHVRIGAGTRIAHHAVLDGHTVIGSNNQIASFVSLGGAPQDKKYAGEPTRLEIGNGNVIREFSFFNTGTVQGGGVTRLGDNNWMMAYTHLAHDCMVGNNTIFANNAQIAGHVIVGDWVILGAFTAVHQFVQIGSHAMTGMGSILLQDIPPFVTVSGNTAEPHGINAEGLKRRGFSSAAINAIRSAYKTLYKSALTLDEARAAITVQAQGEQESGVAAHLETLLVFLQNSQRGIVR